MKISLYLDVGLGFTPEYAHADYRPTGIKEPGVVRYRLDFEIADPAKVDQVVKPAVTVELPA